MQSPYRLLLVSMDEREEKTSNTDKWWVKLYLGQFDPKSELMVMSSEHLTNEDPPFGIG